MRLGMFHSHCVPANREGVKSGRSGARVWGFPSARINHIEFRCVDDRNSSSNSKSTANFYIKSILFNVATLSNLKYLICNQRADHIACKSQLVITI